eukprot:tig00020603_g11792.t1
MLGKASTLPRCSAYSGPYTQPTCIEQSTPGFSTGTLFTVDDRQCFTTDTFGEVFRDATAAWDRVRPVILEKGWTPFTDDGKIYFRVSCAGQKPNIATYKEKNCVGDITYLIDLGSCAAENGTTTRYMRWGCSFTSAALPRAAPSLAAALLLALLAAFVAL